MRHRRHRLAAEQGHLDLVPLIDCVFLLLLFFMLCGHLTTAQRDEQISVPPARTAGKPVPAERLVVNLRGGGRPLARLGSAGAWQDLSLPAGHSALRAQLDAVWDRSAKLPPRDGVTPSAAVLEIRADGDVPMRTIQELQMSAATGKPFINLEFAVRSPAAG